VTILSSTRRRFALTAIFLVFALVSCVRPLKSTDSDETEEAPDSATPVVLPQLSTPTMAVPIDAPSDLEPGTGDTLPSEPGGETTSPPVGGETGGPEEYIVQAGDTLSAIAKRFEVTVEALAAANGISNVHDLDVGQRLVIPAGVVVAEPTEVPPTPVVDRTEEIIHIVQAGENLYRIGLRYGISYQELGAYNGTPAPYYISTGQEIKIPATVE